MAGSNNDDTGVHLVIPRSVLGWLCAGLLSAGSGLGFAVSPGLEKSALKQCFDNSKTALGVAAQHGEELLHIRREIQELRSHGYTIDQHREDSERTRRDLESIDFRLRAVEK